MIHWQECPTCAQDFDVDRWGWNDETAEAWRLAKAAPDMAARIERLETEKADLLDVLKDMVYEGEGHVAAEVVERARDLIAKAEVT